MLFLLLLLVVAYCVVVFLFLFFKTIIHVKHTEGILHIHEITTWVQDF